ncbi:MAG: hypothetical protein E6G41_16055, partial [Actinobacteria bacterium]
MVAARGGLAASFTKETLRVLVGLWPAIHDDPAAKQIERGPQTSGVFARMSPDGRSLALLDGQGHPAHTLRAGAGLVAATSFEHGRPVWVVTGTDVRGLSDAAESLQQGVLRNRFALVTDHGSPLHAARATAGALFCIAGATLAGVVPNPMVTFATALAAFAVAVACGVGREVAGSLRLSIPLSLVLVVINVFVVRRGLTVFARLGEVPPVGQVDLTVEALVAGGLVALHVIAVMAWASVFARCVNPDGLLDAFRRLSFRSALSATLATRLIPVLSRDAERFA